MISAKATINITVGVVQNAGVVKNANRCVISIIYNQLSNIKSFDVKYYLKYRIKVILVFS